MAIGDPILMPSNHTNLSQKERKSSRKSSVFSCSMDDVCHQQPKPKNQPWQQSLEMVVIKKTSAPIKCGWAHRVRQVFSADTLRIALLKPRTRDPLEPPQMTLDGITAPHCQRGRRSGRKKRQ
eukprot:478424_1